MNFSQKLRALRKQFKFSQEQLAEKLGVSRQAITKWETDGGLPDIENLISVAALSSVSMDDLLSEEKLISLAPGYSYESVTEYDISRSTHFDIKTIGAFEIIVTVSESEKLFVRLASNVLQTLSQDCKVKLDEHRNHLDVDIHRTGKISDAEWKKALFIYISLPMRLTEKVELSAFSDTLRICGTDFPFEFDGKIHKVHLENVKSIIALNCNLDMEIMADGLPAAIEVNQINAASVLRVPIDAKYYTRIKGKSNRIRFTNESSIDLNAEHRIEVAGMNAELLVEHEDVS
jgi:transcriptional regulator with XRE-family HTH domain